MTQRKAFKREVRRRMERTGESYTAARMRVVDRRGAPRVAVTNGDSVAGTLLEGHLADQVIAWRDVLYEGPVPAVPAARLRRIRAEYLARRYAMASAEVETQLAQCDAALRRSRSSELTLWFEADLHDQLQLIQILARLGGNLGLRLISIGEHPDRARFGGLGELTPQELETLTPLARPISPAGLKLAARTWAAFTAPEPSGLVALAGVISPDLRFLGDAIRRMLQEYPSRGDGLSLTQRRLLLTVDRGLDTLPQILRAHWQMEPRPFLGDSGCKADLNDMTEGPAPALAETGGRYTLTAFGRRLLAGSDDWVEANGVDRWLGGVHLSGREVPWRYDERLETLVKAP